MEVDEFDFEQGVNMDPHQDFLETETLPQSSNQSFWNKFAWIFLLVGLLNVSFFVVAWFCFVRKRRKSVDDVKPEQRLDRDIVVDVKQEQRLDRHIVKKIITVVPNAKPVVQPQSGLMTPQEYLRNFHMTREPKEEVVPIKDSFASQIQMGKRNLKKNCESSQVVKTQIEHLERFKFDVRQNEKQKECKNVLVMRKRVWKSVEQQSTASTAPKAKRMRTDSTYRTYFKEFAKKVPPIKEESSGEEQNTSLFVCYPGLESDSDEETGYVTCYGGGNAGGGLTSADEEYFSCYDWNDATKGPPK